MIKARAVIRDGFFQLQFSGHANADTCAAASMMMHACALGLRDLSNQHPRELEFTHDVDFQGWNKLDSKTRRRAR